MKKVLITSYETSEVFIIAPNNTSRDKIFHVARRYAQEITGRSIITLANYNYETESEWHKRKFDNPQDEWFWDRIPVINIEDYED